MVKAAKDGLLDLETVKDRLTLVERVQATLGGAEDKEVDVDEYEDIAVNAFDETDYLCNLFLVPLRFLGRRPGNP